MAEDRIGQPLSSDPGGVEETNGTPVWSAGWLFDETKRGIENFGSVVLGDVMSGKRKGIYGESMYFMEEDVPDEAVIKKVNERFYEMADESIILKDMKDVYNGWMREEEMAIKILELLIRMAEK